MRRGRSSQIYLQSCRFSFLFLPSIVPIVLFCLFIVSTRWKVFYLFHSTSFPFSHLLPHIFVVVPSLFSAHVASITPSASAGQFALTRSNNRECFFDYTLPTCEHTDLILGSFSHTERSKIHILACQSNQDFSARRENDTFTQVPGWSGLHYPQCDTRHEYYCVSGCHCSQCGDARQDFYYLKGMQPAQDL